MLLHTCAHDVGNAVPENALGETTWNREPKQFKQFNRIQPQIVALHLFFFFLRNSIHMAIWLLAICHAIHYTRFGIHFVICCIFVCLHYVSGVVYTFMLKNHVLCVKGENHLGRVTKSSFLFRKLLVKEISE